MAWYVTGYTGNPTPESKDLVEHVFKIMRLENVGDDVEWGVIETTGMTAFIAGSVRETLNGLKG